jgi:hypothetical protein
LTIFVQIIFRERSKPGTDDQNAFSASELEFMAVIHISIPCADIQAHRNILKLDGYGLVRVRV